MIVSGFGLGTAASASNHGARLIWLKAVRYARPGEGYGMSVPAAFAPGCIVFVSKSKRRPRESLPSAARASRLSTGMRAGERLRAVKVTEVVTRLNAFGWQESDIRQFLTQLGVTVKPFDAELAFEAGRPCIPVLTADRAWSRVSVGVTSN